MAKRLRPKRDSRHTITLKFSPDEMKYLRRAAGLSDLTVAQLCRAILGLRLAALEMGRT